MKPIIKGFPVTMAGTKKQYYQAFLFYYMLFIRHVEPIEGIFSEQSKLQTGLPAWCAFVGLVAKKSGNRFGSGFEGDHNIGMFAYYKDDIIDVVNRFPEDLLGASFLTISNHTNIDVACQFFPYYVEWAIGLINDTRDSYNKDFSSLQRKAFFKMFAYIVKNGKEAFVLNYEDMRWTHGDTYDDDLEDELKNNLSKLTRGYEKYMEDGTHRYIAGDYQAVFTLINSWIEEYYPMEGEENYEPEIDDRSTYGGDSTTEGLSFSITPIQYIVAIGVLSGIGFFIYKKKKSKKGRFK